MTATILIKAIDAARRLGINRSTLHRWVKAGKIECVQIERNSVYFTQEQLDDFDLPPILWTHS
ncbi:MAG: helix-turn-helix domain-containing protein [Calditrichaeota bacterium]|jgi:excisionase family DNA binding protein|nr:helix-turn-helix domain-containing protein [Calditrichota bacterium]